MSVGLNPDGVPQRHLKRTVAEIAREWRLDPRIPEAIPGFDAPFYQAGLAGYSDGAMRLIARSLRYASRSIGTIALLLIFLPGSRPPQWAVKRPCTRSLL